MDDPLFTWMFRARKWQSSFHVEVQNVFTLSILALALSIFVCPSPQEASYFVCSFDELYNCTKKKGQMDRIVLFWDNSTANICERRQVWMYTQNSNHMQSHLMQAKWFRFSLIFLSFSVIWWVYIQLLDFYKYSSFFIFVWNNRMHMLIN